MLLMTLSLVFGFLNTNKVKTLRNELAATTSARDVVDRGRVASQKKLKATETDLEAVKSQAAEAAAKAQNAEVELGKVQSEKAGVEAKLRANETQIADLQKRVSETTIGTVSGTVEGDAPNDLRAALTDTRTQLAAAEQEKTLLAEKMRAAQDRLAAMEAEKRKRQSAANSPGVHGTVLAVNQAYNFVVLGIGNRQGVVANSEMLVMRQGSLIGKIRISSVEPTTSIGDIISNSLARGVQVQPGDTVVYAGNTNS